MNASYHINHLFIPPIRFDNIDLIQIGRRFCSPDTVVPKHLHLNWFELTIATNGKGILTTNDEDIEIKRGDIYLSFPADEHAIRSDPTEPLAYNFISIYPNNPEQLQPLEQLMLAFRDPKSRMFSDEKILFLVDNTLAEFNSDKTVRSYNVVCNLLSLIITYLLRNFSETMPPDRSERRPPMLCFYLMHYIDTHILTMQNLTELSDVFHYNYSYLSKLFKTVTGRTLTDYYTASRLKKAEILLKAENRKIGEIAELLGYSSIYAFSKAFKSRYGVSPEKIRRTE